MKTFVGKIIMITLSVLAVSVILIAIILPGEFSMALHILSMVMDRQIGLTLYKIKHTPLCWLSMVAAVLIMAARFIPREYFTATIQALQRVSMQLLARLTTYSQIRNSRPQEPSAACSCRCAVIMDRSCSGLYRC